MSAFCNSEGGHYFDVKMKNMFTNIKYYLIKEI